MKKSWRTCWGNDSFLKARLFRLLTQTNYLMRQCQRIIRLYHTIRYPVACDTNALNVSTISAFVFMLGPLQKPQRGLRWPCMFWVVMIALVAALGYPQEGRCADEALAIGQIAPDFTLTDADNRSLSLKDFAGQFVVLEWMNPDCPFVRKHYDSDNMQALQRAYTGKGVVWLSIDSSAPEKQGHLTQQMARAFLEQRQAKPSALLLDPDGTVGRLYKAKTTPHLFIIDPQGRLIYEGAIDDTPSVDPADVETARNYVRQALEEALAGKPVSTPQTRSYGCSVKYD